MAGAMHAVARLAHAQKGPPEEHLLEGGGKGSADGGEAPEANAEGQEAFTVIAVTQPPHEGRGQGINDHEGDAQYAVLAVVEMELLLDDLADGEEDVAVDVVQEVHAEQDGEREVSAWEGFGRGPF